MSTFDEFYQMAREMLSDPDIRSDAVILTNENKPDPLKPWEGPISSDVTNYVTCFYYKPKNGLVNGTVVATGQKAVLVQVDIPEASLLLATWVDAAAKRWSIKAVEPVVLNDKVVLYKLLIGV